MEIWFITEWEKEEWSEETSDQKKIIHPKCVTLNFKVNVDRKNKKIGRKIIGIYFGRV